MEEQITIFLTTPEAIMFRDFQQFHKTFMMLVESGVFDQKKASVTIDFDHNGNISMIRRSDILLSQYSIDRDTRDADNKSITE